MTTIVPQCSTCKHFKRGMGRGVTVCTAFPSDIPREILFNEWDHRKPHPQDNGVQWEALPGKRHPMEPLKD